MNGNEYQQACLRTAGTLDQDELIMNGVLGLNGESGEVADIIKKHAFQGHKLDEVKLAKELGDIMWYVAITAYALEYTLDEIMEMNIEKLKQRYPDGFSAERSVNRNDLQEVE